MESSPTIVLDLVVDVLQFLEWNPTITQVKFTSLSSIIPSRCHVPTPLSSLPPSPLLQTSALAWAHGVLQLLDSVIEQSLKQTITKRSSSQPQPEQKRIDKDAHALLLLSLAFVAHMNSIESAQGKQTPQKQQPKTQQKPAVVGKYVPHLFALIDSLKDQLQQQGLDVLVRVKHQQNQLQIQQSQEQQQPDYLNYNDGNQSSEFVSLRQILCVQLGAAFHSLSCQRLSRDDEKKLFGLFLETSKFLLGEKGEGEGEEVKKGEARKGRKEGKGGETSEIVNFLSAFGYFLESRSSLVKDEYAVKKENVEEVVDMLLGL